MTKHAKIALNGSRDIPFNLLVLSQANVRRVKAGVSIDALAADIARRGLLQSLSVRPQRDESGQETGLFEVPAGGRRFRALQQLVKAKRLARTVPVPCIVRDDAQVSAEEDSLAENTHREALHPLDQFRAMQALALQGTDTETIAATFMVTPAVVKQRLRLASVSPRLHEVYAEDGMTLEQLMAFSVSDDHARQEQIWELLSKGHNQSPWLIRSRLTEETVAATDRRARFVGIDAYVAAGGCVLRDLFEADNGGWLQDPAILDRLVDEKLEAEARAIGEEGWKWVAVAVEFPFDHDDGLRELHGVTPERSSVDEVRLAALEAEAEQLEAEWSGAGDVPEHVEARVHAIDEEIAGIVSPPLVYDPAEVAIAGVFVSLNRDGSLRVERGLVRPDDEPAAPGEPGDGEDDAEHDADPDNSAREPQGAVISIGGAPGSPGASEEGEDEQEDMLRPLPDRLVTELTTHRTLALRDAVARSPQVAFAAVLHAVVLDTFYRHAGAETCMEMSVRGGSLGIHAPGLSDSPSATAIAERHDGWKARLPEKPDALWDTLAALDSEDQAALFAHCVSFGINAVWEPANRYADGRVSPRTVAGRIEHSHVVAAAAALDMVAAGWSPTVDNYLGRVTKARILLAVEEAKGADVAARIAGLKKGDMASEAERLLDGSGWLAEPLREPMPPQDAEPAADALVAPGEQSAALGDERPVDAAGLVDQDGDGDEEIAIAAE